MTLQQSDSETKQSSVCAWLPSPADRHQPCRGGARGVAAAGDAGTDPAAVGRHAAPVVQVGCVCEREGLVGDHVLLSLGISTVCVRPLLPPVSVFFCLQRDLLAVHSSLHCLLQPWPWRLMAASTRRRSCACSAAISGACGRSSWQRQRKVCCLLVLALSWLECLNVLCVLLHTAANQPARQAGSTTPRYGPPHQPPTPLNPKPANLPTQPQHNTPLHLFSPCALLLLLLQASPAWSLW